jgi:outer membrane lipoprotein
LYKTEKKGGAVIKRVLIVLLALFLASCTYVIRKDLMGQGTRNPSLDALIQNPDAYRGKLFILGGLIARTTLKPEGSQVEAIYVSVDSFGLPEEATLTAHRYLALYPRDQGVLDPLIYKESTKITVAGIFTGTTQSKVDDMEYVFPVFNVIQIHLEKKEPAVVYEYYPYYWGPGWWGYPWGPWY